MFKNLILIGVAAAIVTGCGGAPAPTSTPAASQPAAKPEAPKEATAAPPMRNFAAIKIGTFDVQPMFEEEIEDGHFNIKITGGEVKAVRIWVGGEDASGALVAKTEIENGYHHGHVEMETPVPTEAALWIEIETPTGETLRGSTPLVQAP